MIEVRYACFWGNNLSILYVEETFSYFKRYSLKNLLAFHRVKCWMNFLNFPTFMTNLSKTKNNHYFINKIHQKFEKISLEICKNLNKKDTYLISTTLLFIYFSSPRTKELLQNWVKFFSFAAVECRYILLTTIENLIYLSTFDSGTVSFYTPSHKKTPQLKVR